MFFQNTFRAFRHRDFLIFWIGLFLGHTGTLIQTTAQGWLIFQLTDSPFYLGLDGLCLGLPRLIFSAPGGAIVDRANRRAFFMFTQSVFLVMALFLGLMTAFGAIQVWHVLTVSAVTGFFLSFEQPIRQTILHDIVPKEDLLNAVSLYQMIFNGSVLFGPAIGGALIPIVGTEGCFFLHALGNLIILVTVFMIPISRRPAAAKDRSVLKDVTEAVVVSWSTPVFYALFFSLTIVSLFSKSYAQFMPVFARDVLGVGAPGLGLLLMAPGAGAICGGLTQASLQRPYQPRYLLFFEAAGFAVFLMLFATSRVFYLSFIFLFFVGAFQTTMLSLTATLLQMHSRPDMRGRMMALYGLLNRGLGPMGAFPMGILATAIGAPLTVALGAVLGLAGTTYMTMFKPYLRSLDTKDEPAPTR
jgi:MFS family permease